MTTLIIPKTKEFINPIKGFNALKSIKNSLQLSWLTTIDIHRMLKKHTILILSNDESLLTSLHLKLITESNIKSEIGIAEGLSIIAITEDYIRCNITEYIIPFWIPYFGAKKLHAKNKVTIKVYKSIK